MLQQTQPGKAIQATKLAESPPGKNKQGSVREGHAIMDRQCDIASA